MNRLEAATTGIKFFDSLKPCKRDGTTQRYTTNGGCVACEKKRSAGTYANFRALIVAAKGAALKVTSGL